MANAMGFFAVACVYGGKEACHPVSLGSVGGGCRPKHEKGPTARFQVSYDSFVPVGSLDSLKAGGRRIGMVARGGQRQTNASKSEVTPTPSRQFASLCLLELNNVPGLCASAVLPAQSCIDLPNTQLPTMPDLHTEFGVVLLSHGVERNTHEISLLNFDTRRSIEVTLPNTSGCFELPDDPEFEIPVSEAAKALRTYLDSGDAHPGTVAIEIDKDGKLLSFCTDLERDTSRCTAYLPLEDYQFSPATVKTILRSELAEVRRSLGVGFVDLVSYPESLPCSREGKNDRYVFKYSPFRVLSLWAEVHFLARLPPHPNMALLDRLVLDEMTGSRIVGFVAGASLDKLESRPPFKLKWLRQLMQTVDDLNLKHGVVHQDIADRNLLIDPDTDSIILLDFGLACRTGAASKLTKEIWVPLRDDGMYLCLPSNYSTQPP